MRAVFSLPFRSDQSTSQRSSRTSAHRANSVEEDESNSSMEPKCWSRSRITFNVGAPADSCMSDSYQMSSNRSVIRVSRLRNRRELHSNLALKALHTRYHAVDGPDRCVAVRARCVLLGQLIGHILHGAHFLFNCLLRRAEHLAVVLIGHLCSAPSVLSQRN